MKTVLKLGLWVLSIVFAYLIYLSVNAPIEFKKIKQERFAEVISVMKDIRNSQEAYKTVKGEFAKDFNSLIQFIDTARYTITQQRDSSFYEFNKVYKIDMLKEIKIVDTLGFISIKDSLFKKDTRYKNMMNVPFGQNGEQFKMEAKVIRKNDYRVPVFRISVDKTVILYDQAADLMATENSHINVEEVNGPQIIVGSLEDVSSNGNWPPIYDKKRKN
ncbi:MAG: hypothetical protein QNL28_06650 [Flavobacteriaceae bacterium]|tara:strand:+ start:26 stop:676 length:651 start_codon:yes stop_codon:yes gene_type:complete